MYLKFRNLIFLTALLTNCSEREQPGKITYLAGANDTHIMGGYHAGYYSYIWSEVLDADSVEWFKENGGLKRENGDHFRKTLLSRGGAKDAMALFREFRGRDADITPLLVRRGLN